MVLEEGRRRLPGAGRYGGRGAGHYPRGDRTISGDAHGGGATSALEQGKRTVVAEPMQFQERGGCCTAFRYVHATRRPPELDRSFRSNYPVKKGKT